MATGTELLIEFQEGQGLGNQLWNYTVIRSIAEYIGASWSVYCMENFKGKEFLKIGTPTQCFDHAASSYRPVPPCIFNELTYVDEDIKYAGSDYDERLFRLHGTYIIKGLLQSERYFFDNVQRLSEYVQLTDQDKKLDSIPPHSCIINLRGGEYKRHKRFILPYSYWDNAIKNMKTMTDIDEFIVVTDDYRYARSMFPNLRVISGCIERCYRAIYLATNIIVSNSTFSYFPIKTSPINKIVIAPKYWARFNSPKDRWASTSNIYSDWLWQTRDGTLQSYEECMKEVERTKQYYISQYFYLYNSNKLTRDMLPFIHPRLKQQVKNFFSILFPRFIG